MNKINYFKEYIEQRLSRGVTNNWKIYAEIKIMGYSGSYATVNRYLKQNRIDKQVQQYKISRHIETSPGKQAQVDWGSFGKVFVNGKEERLYCFVFVLSYSRALYIEFTIKQNIQTLQQCHINAFKYLGIPKEIVYDNMKTVVISREKLPDDHQKIHLNSTFVDFANYYGFTICPTSPYWPRAKGKVESAVKFVRHNFMNGVRYKREFNSVSELNQKASPWLTNVANNRIHKSTFKKPMDLWEEEKQYLNYPVAIKDYSISPLIERYSTKDSLVQHKCNFYSIPKQFARKKLLLKEENENGTTKIVIYFKNKIIADHLLSTERGKWIINKKHFMEIKEKRILKIPTSVINKSSKKAFINPTYSRDLSYYTQLFTKN